MVNQFFERPVLNSPYEYPTRHWELDAQGQPTQQIIDKRRSAEYITPIPKPKKQKASVEQKGFIFDEGKGLSTEDQQYEPTPIINELRGYVDRWRSIAKSRLTGRSPQKPPVFSSTGDITRSPVSGRSSVRSRPSRLPYG